MTCLEPEINPTTIIVNANSSGVYAVGYGLTFECKSRKYEARSGDNERYCTASGVWNGTALECAKKRTGDSGIPVR